VLQNELSAHDPELLNKPSLVVVSKTDLLTEARRDEIAQLFAALGQTPLFLSAITGTGRRDLLEAIWTLVERARQKLQARAEAEPQAEPQAEPEHEPEDRPEDR
jgi:GTP-binding protein